MKYLLPGILVLVSISNVQAVPTTLSGTGTATVDAVFSPGEWDSAGALDLLVNLPGGDTTQGRFSIMNDAHNIYFGLVFGRGVLDPGNSLAIEFDTDASGSLSPGDDGIILNPAPSVGFGDLYRSSDFDCPPNLLCSFRDSGIGGHNDGAGAFSNDGTNTVYELSHPLNSGDSFDVSLQPGDIIGFSLFNRIIETGGVFPDGFGDTSTGFDFAEFSVTAVPEPAAITLLGIGLVAFGLNHRRRRLAAP